MTTLAVYCITLTLAPYGRRVRLADLRRALDGLLSREEQDQSLKELAARGKVILLAEADPSLEDLRAALVVDGVRYHALKPSI